jgi:hypothetical protein
MNSNLARLDFDLAYLILLTKKGIKPLSRWEESLSREKMRIIESTGLQIALPARFLQDGSKKEEIVFSNSSELLHHYCALFDSTFIDYSAKNVLAEGLLFGYPRCCIEHFIKNGYAENHLPLKDQEILFHWSCPGCAATYTLLKKYRPVYEECVRLYGKPELLITTSFKKKLKKSLVIAASISLVLPGLFQNGTKLFAQDPHWIPLQINEDIDSDFLLDSYEKIIGFDDTKPDTDQNGVPDGIQLAKEVYQSLQELPHVPRQDGPYIIDHMMRGLVWCSVCDSAFNMGYAEIVNPLENLKMEIPYLSLHHFLRHGSFMYSPATDNTGSVMRPACISF